MPNPAVRHRLTGHPVTVDETRAAEARLVEREKKSAQGAAWLAEQAGHDERPCGSEPPEALTDPATGRQWQAGDCWCTLPAGHDTDTCVCGPCQARTGAPGWPNPEHPQPLEP